MTRMARRSRLFLALVLWAVPAGSASAQGTQRTPPSFDASGSAGWFFAAPRSPAGPDRGRDWYGDALSAGATLGWYWTGHLKTELAVGATTEGELSGAGAPIQLGNATYVVPHVVSFHSVRSIGVRQIYQFGRNAWVHPYVGIGLSADWQGERSYSPPVGRVERTAAGFVDVPVRPAVETGPETRLEGRAHGLVGVKAYLTQRLFVRTDVTVGARRRVDQVAWRLGFGVDF